MNDAVFVPERTTVILRAGLQNGAVDFFQNLWGALQKVDEQAGRIAITVERKDHSQGGTS